MVKIMQITGDDCSVQMLEIDPNIVKSARQLLYAPERYFDVTPRCRVIPLASLVLSHIRTDGVRNAVTLMVDAYNGLIDRRAAIRVRRFTANQFLVLDGNSTVTIATAAGWPDIPCIVEFKH